MASNDVRGEVLLAEPGEPHLKKRIACVTYPADPRHKQFFTLSSLVAHPHPTGRARWIGYFLRKKLSSLVAHLFFNVRNMASKLASFILCPASLRSLGQSKIHGRGGKCECSLQTISLQFNDKRNWSSKSFPNSRLFPPRVKVSLRLVPRP